MDKIKDRAANLGLTLEPIDIERVHEFSSSNPPKHRPRHSQVPKRATSSYSRVRPGNSLTYWRPNCSPTSIEIALIETKAALNLPNDKGEEPVLPSNRPCIWTEEVGDERIDGEIKNFQGLFPKGGLAQLMMGAEIKAEAKIEEIKDNMGGGTLEATRRVQNICRLVLL
ncbi:uncharacterized protein BCR38DRAFT_413051 [Pseudomassariella vexata]|uniref:Uncharacterized protein n=1 Tax=Pseudomassariella vexata TaxID=1141098 RepID=A0A1Y2DHK2_9PEZI|nr:uncharacterized protein BCR38DRAFT_413051 [Pseudomassariella vexata]ORY58732.1 hypothetical protein BCR38DRAFT_413051 [Pseudomassariella vexata]